MKPNRSIFSLCLFNFSFSLPLNADRIRLNLAGWSGNAESEMTDRNAIDLNHYAALQDIGIRSIAHGLGQEINGHLPVNYNQSPQSPRNSSPAPSGIEYWLTSGRNAVILSASAYTFNPTFRYTFYGIHSPTLAGAKLYDRTTVGTSSTQLTTRAAEFGLGLRLAFTENLFITPHVSSLSLRREWRSSGFSAELTTMMGVTLDPALYIDDRSLNGTALGGLAGFGIEYAFSRYFAIILDFSSTPYRLRGRFSEMKTQTVLPSPGSDPVLHVTINNDRMKVGVIRGMLGFQITFLDDLHLRFGYLHENHNISYAAYPIQLLVSSSSIQTSSDFLDQYQYFYQMIILREVLTHKAVETDSKGGAYLGISYDLNITP